MATRISPNPVWQLIDQGGDIIATINNDGSATIPAGGSTATAGPNGTSVLSLQTKVLISSAQLLALKGTPLTLISAPGPGKLIVTNQATFRYVFNSVAYTLNAGTIKLFQGPVANAKTLTASVATGLIDQVVNTTNIGVPTTATGNLTDAQAVNTAVMIANDGAAEFTLGNGTLEVIVDYQVIAVP